MNVPIGNGRLEPLGHLEEVGAFISEEEYSEAKTSD